MSLLVWITRYLSLIHSLFYILNPTGYETIKQLGDHPSYICFKLYFGRYNFLKLEAEDNSQEVMIIWIAIK